MNKRRALVFGRFWHRVLALIEKWVGLDLRFSFMGSSPVNRLVLARLV